MYFSESKEDGVGSKEKILGSTIPCRTFFTSDRTIQLLKLKDWCRLDKKVATVNPVCRKSPHGTSYCGSMCFVRDGRLASEVDFTYV